MSRVESREPNPLLIMRWDLEPLGLRVGGGLCRRFFANPAQTDSGFLYCVSALFSARTYTIRPYKQHFFASTFDLRPSTFDLTSSTFDL